MAVYIVDPCTSFLIFLFTHKKVVYIIKSQLRFFRKEMPISNCCKRVKPINTVEKELSKWHISIDI